MRSVSWLFVLVLLASAGCRGPHPPYADLDDHKGVEQDAWDIRDWRPPPPGIPSIKEARRVLTDKPDCAKAILDMGYALYAEGKFSQLESHLRQASGSLTDTLTKYASSYLMALSIHGQGRLEEAAKLYESLAEEAPRHYWRSWHYYEAGYVHRKLANIDRAGELFKKSVDAYEGEYRAAFFLGGIHAHFGRKQKAESYFRLALQHATDDIVRANCLHALGRLAEELGNFAEAEELYQQALKYNPHHELALLGLERTQNAQIALGPNSQGARP